jgi:hypothetical protein
MRSRSRERKAVIVRPLTWLLVLGAAALGLAAFGGTSLLDEVRERGGDVLALEADDGGQGAAQISADEFLRIGQGTSTERLRALAGEPETRSTARVEGVELECWYYGIAGDTGAFQLCFSDDRLVSRFRFSARALQAR